jgi:flagellar basal body rod protein FlgB
MRQGLFGTPTLDSLKQSLDIMSLREQVSAHNMANAETEGFVPRRVEFQASLEQAMGVPPVTLARTSPGHQFPIGLPPASPPPIRLVPNPGAGIEDFMVDLVESTYMYQASAKLLAGQYGALHESIRGRVA